MRRVIEADREAARAGRGSFQINGKTIDISVVLRPHPLLARREAIVAREAKTLAAMRSASRAKQRSGPGAGGSAAQNPRLTGRGCGTG